MPETHLASIGETMAVDICRRVQVEKSARKLLGEKLTALQFVQTLVDAGHFSDATRIMAYLLPVRDAIWWAIQSARQNPPRNAEPEVELALAAAEEWVRKMSEESRYGAQTAAEAAGLGTASGCAAMAAFTSGRSLASPDQPAVPPDPALAPQLVSASIIASALLPNPAEAAERYRIFLRHGIELYRASRADGPEERSA
jgi:hypothetical protein